MISAEYRHVYQLIILPMVKKIFKHVLNNLLTVARYGNFLLVSTNWSIFIIWLIHVPWYAHFLHRVLKIKILIFSYRARGLSAQMERYEFVLNITVLFLCKYSSCRMKQCATKIINTATISDCSDSQNIIFMRSKWIQMQKTFIRHDSNLYSCLKWRFCFYISGS